jgi:serine/threonine protein kinase/formylglycine-generating enzyme required for sulfatase activity
MAESFPPAPGGSAGSFPQGHEPRDDAPTQDAGLLLFRRYRVLRELGRGGMGVVLLAQDTALGIPVAIKLVPDLVVKDTEAINDLRKEVLRGMALNHDGVVRTHHFEKDESGAAIVMEFVEGDNLTELKVRQPGGCFDPEQLLPWLEQLCAVLDYAHREKRLVHRDLKPRNVMLTPAGRIKVADFGIAAVLSESRSRHSMEGKISGTLGYMSPQQAEGKRPAPADDVYSLGAMLYELLTGKPPFFRGGEAAIFSQILQVIPPSLAERREELEVTGKAPIPPQWEETIAACLAKEPAERPQSAGEVLARLKVVAAPSPPKVEATPRRFSDADAAGVPRPPSATRASQPPLRWPWAAGLAALALAAGGAYYFTTDRGQERANPTPAPATPHLISPAPATPPPLPTPVPTPRPATPAPPPAPTPMPATPSPATPSPATPSPATPPPATPKPPPSPAERLAAASKDEPFQNSLGQRFVPAGTPGVLFCIWETRVKDFEEFVTRSGYDMKKGERAYTLESGGWKQAGGDWRNPRFPEPQGEDHPVVCVSLADAKEFCDWLTSKELRDGTLPPGARYRLPSDAEWSAAVGEGAYPWGSGYPPRQPVGNYAGTESKVGAAKSFDNWTTIPGYNDGFPRTAPVGSFAPNRYGIFDLGGNVWEWCDTPYKASMNSAEALKKFPVLKEEKASDGTAFRVLRGASWCNDGSVNLGASSRDYGQPLGRSDNLGFRVVLVSSGR